MEFVCSPCVFVFLYLVVRDWRWTFKGMLLLDDDWDWLQLPLRPWKRLGLEGGQTVLCPALFYFFCNVKYNTRLKKGCKKLMDRTHLLWKIYSIVLRWSDRIHNSVLLKHCSFPMDLLSFLEKASYWLRNRSAATVQDFLHQYSPKGQPRYRLLTLDSFTLNLIRQHRIYRIYITFKDYYYCLIEFQALWLPLHWTHLTADFKEDPNLFETSFNSYVLYKIF